MKEGIRVDCSTCGYMKKPIGRSGPAGASYCTEGCPGYYQAPMPGSLWPGETEADFGYPVGDHGTIQTGLQRLDPPGVVVRAGGAQE